MALSPDIQAKVNQWLSDEFDATTRTSIQKLIDDQNETELVDSFYKNLEFGTGGLRGIMGAGTNRMNVYTVSMATQGLCNYLKKTYPDSPISVAIAHDSRNNSPLFAKTTADVFTANGIKVYFFSELRPTPELSFAIRHFGCQSGVVITASHNPKEYNGYKAYWNDGAQMLAPHDKNTIEEVDKILSITQVKREGNPALLVPVLEEVDQIYLDRIVGSSISKDAIQRQKDLKIVYSSLHGTGITMVPKALSMLGFTNVNIVQAQATPDGNFPTVVYPNPEETEAMTLGLKLAEDLDADLVMATDPDADRVGLGLKNPDGKWQLLNGNQISTLLIYYMLNAWRNAGKITGHEMIIKTIVTTDIQDKMAEAYGVKCFNTLTGFKHIAKIIREQEGKLKFIVGGEESYGYMVGDFVRDKDAVAACAMIAEMVAFAKDKGLTLFDLLIEIFKQFGFYKEDLISITKKGKTGAEEIQEMMAGYRSNPPKTIAGSEVLKIYDYKESTVLDLKTGEKTAITIDKSNVLQFLTADGSKISARPSGTEPKIKFYFSVNESLSQASDYSKIEKKLDEKIQAIVKDLGLR
ncbi:MAG TPA: phospho-sugar mutase [Catalimonadaceae bacterium]|nr:phospho-sugar mutase [Catalimonadaceae bacterium]